jgi:murein DD-endopeptidase
VPKYHFATPPPYRGVARVLGVLLGLSVLLNIILLVTGDDDGDDADAVEPADGATEEPDATPADESAPVPDDGEADETTPPATAAPVAAKVGEFTALEGIDAPLKVNLSVTIDGVVEGRRSAWVTATTGRIMVWWLDMTTDLRAGDRLRMLYEPGDADDVRIAVLSYQSQKMAQDFRAYYFRPEAASHGSYWDASGKEIPPRLKDPLIEDYDQITAVLGDGRDHKGWDFRAPTGTPVFAPRAAKVLRTTWNFKYNGNSLELRFADGTIARYLHLERVADGVTADSNVRAGQKIATSGNTGRTNAPHLHYEVEQAGRVVDPGEYHGVNHRTLSGDDLDRFREQVARFDEALTTILGS